MLLETDFRQGLPFALFRSPSQTKVRCIVQQSRENKFSEYSENSSGFVFFPYQISEKTPGIFLRKDRFYQFDNIEDFVAQKFSNPPDIGMPSGFSSDFDQKNFEQAVEKIVKEIQNSSPVKVILSCSRTVNRSNLFSPLQTFADLCRNYPNLYVFLFYHPSAGMWLGATPEILLEWKANEMKTLALAGTQPTSSAPIVWESKEKKEFGIVSDYIRRTIMDQKPESISETKPATENYGSVAHLRSEFRFRVPESFSRLRFLDIYHPTPAVLGLPKQEARKLITELEPHSREYYTGYLGETGPEEGSLFVNLRSMKITDKELRIYSGCGITEDSEPEKEWLECLQKQKNLLRFST